MSRPFPKPDDNYPIVFLKDTDLDLPKSVKTRNNTRYAYFKTVARGGKCTIHACKDLHLSRVVCYKSLRPEIADDPFEQRRFLREARVTAMLQHPNTIPVYELGRDKNGHYYFTMKLVQGNDVKDFLGEACENNDPATWRLHLDRSVSILIQVAHALDYAHKHGVVHRDIKPANVLLGPFGEVLVLDWGLAKVWSAEQEVIPDLERADNEDAELTAQGKLQGTAAYMSPEQIEESIDIDHRTDIYSLGSVFYEMLTLEQMAWGETVDEVLEHTRKDSPPTPSDRRPDLAIPEELEEICLACVERAPDDRLPSAGELVDRLRDWRATNELS